ncbi:TPA: glycosyltransferase family 2 protein [Providencia alcalifaciens]
MKIEILISTLNDGIKKIKISPFFNYIIVHQINNGKDYSNESQFLLKYNVRYIQSHTVGLSKSRNIAILNATADYIWIMDDDVIIDSNAFEKLTSIIKSNVEFDMLVLSHSSSSSKNDNKQEELKKLNRITAMSVASIDMFIKKSSIIDNMILFNENFGLGTKYPSGEEYIFTTQLLDLKLTILKTNISFSYHPELSSGHDFYSTKNKLKAKLKMFSVCYGELIGRAAYFLFIMKKIKVLQKNKKITSALKVLFNK